jgi:hypothetical protein
LYIGYTDCDQLVISIRKAISQFTDRKFKFGALKKLSEAAEKKDSTPWVPYQMKIEQAVNRSIVIKSGCRFFVGSFTTLVEHSLSGNTSCTVNLISNNSSSPDGTHEPHPT